MKYFFLCVQPLVPSNELNIGSSYKRVQFLFHFLRKSPDTFNTKSTNKQQSCFTSVTQYCTEKQTEKKPSPEYASMFICKRKSIRRMAFYAKKIVVEMHGHSVKWLFVVVFVVVILVSSFLPISSPALFTLFFVCVHVGHSYISSGWSF